MGWEMDLLLFFVWEGLPHTRHSQLVQPCVEGDASLLHLKLWDSVQISRWSGLRHTCRRTTISWSHPIRRIHGLSMHKYNGSNSEEENDLFHWKLSFDVCLDNAREWKCIRSSRMRFSISKSDFHCICLYVIAVCKKVCQTAFLRNSTILRSKKFSVVAHSILQVSQ